MWGVGILEVGDEECYHIIIGKKSWIMKTEGDNLVGNVKCHDILKFNNTNTNTDISQHINIMFSDISLFSCC